jgi:cytochrome c oxidase subunit 3
MGGLSLTGMTSVTSSVSAVRRGAAAPIDAAPTTSDRRQINRLGLLVGLGGITMLFAAFTSAYIVRSGGGDWTALALPPVVWMSTALIVASSFTLELARRAFHRGSLSSFRSWSAATAALGTGFLVSQYAAWLALNQAGIYLQSHPKSSFFFVLTGVHGAHLLAGVIALLALFGLAAAGRLIPGRSDAPTLTAIYWHFVGGLWIYLLAVLSLLG